MWVKTTYSMNEGDNAQKGLSRVVNAITEYIHIKCCKEVTGRDNLAHTKQCIRRYGSNVGKQFFSSSLAL